MFKPELETGFLVVGIIGRMLRSLLYSCIRPVLCPRFFSSFQNLFAISFRFARRIPRRPPYFLCRTRKTRRIPFSFASARPFATGFPYHHGFFFRHKSRGFREKPMHSSKWLSFGTKRVAFLFISAGRRFGAFFTACSIFCASSCSSGGIIPAFIAKINAFLHMIGAFAISVALFFGFASARHFGALLDGFSHFLASSSSFGDKRPLLSAKSTHSLMFEISLQ